jgi:hypothetical protein
MRRVVAALEHNLQASLRAQRNVERADATDHGNMHRASAVPAAFRQAIGS